MRRIPQFANPTRMVVLAVLLAGGPLFAQGPASVGHTSPHGVIALAAATPAGASATNEATTNAARSRVPATSRSQARTKAGVLAAGILIAITILIVACGLALLSSFKNR